MTEVTAPFMRTRLKTARTVGPNPVSRPRTA